MILKKILKFLGMETYTIPLESFREQFGNMDQLEWKVVKVQTPRGTIRTYKTFPITEVQCLNDAGDTVILSMKPSLEMRITNDRGKRSIFYLDMIRIENDILTGGQSRQLGFIQKTIDLSTVRKIEIQDGKKAYKYLK